MHFVLFLAVPRFVIVKNTLVVKDLQCVVLSSGNLAYFLTQPVLHNWINRNYDVYFLYEIMHVKDTVLLCIK